MLTMAINMEAIAEGENGSYLKFGLVVVVLSAVFLFYVERLSTTLIFRIQRRRLKFEIIDLSKRFHPKKKGTLLLEDIIGLDYEDDEIFIETNRKVYRFNTLGLRELGSSYKSDIHSRYIYDLLKERLGVIGKVNRDRIPLVDRHIFKG